MQERCCVVNRGLPSGGECLVDFMEDRATKQVVESGSSCNFVLRSRVDSFSKFDPVAI
jgi:hypothetical protein